MTFGPYLSLSIEDSGLKYLNEGCSGLGEKGEADKLQFSSLFESGPLVKGPPWVVSLGDSFSSGEAGRWAGNTVIRPPTGIDALGSKAYLDNEGKSEYIQGCHRSISAEIHIGNQIESENFACSGAKTTTYIEWEEFKPGLDFYNQPRGRGQALMLSLFAWAKKREVKMVLVSIGGNEFHFGEIVTKCVEAYFKYFGFAECHNNAELTKNFTGNVPFENRAKIKKAIENVATAMGNAGVKENEYTILVQDYPSLVPLGEATPGEKEEFRYPDNGNRVWEGGCEFSNGDANWLNRTVVPTIDAQVLAASQEAEYIGAKLKNVKFLDLMSTLKGHRLCEKGVNLLEQTAGPLKSWNENEATAANETGWVNQIHIASEPENGILKQESVHPNYWAQLALRNCIRQAYNNGVPKGGTCKIAPGGGVNNEKPAEPNMRLE
jgi:hypothetical protein